MRPADGVVAERAGSVRAMTVRPTTGGVWFPQAAMGVAILVVGVTLVLPQHRNSPVELLLHLFLVAGYALAAGVSRRLPGWSLVAAMTIGLLQAVTGGGVLVAQVALLVVLYTAARWGAAPALSALTIPFGAAVGLVQLSSLHVSDGGPATGDAVTELLLSRAVYWHTGSLVLLGAVLLACAWVSGFAVRMRDRAVRSELDTAAAREAATVADETARLRSAQAELARDVHDVVGHSLAVVLAQAEAARLLDDPARVREMLGNIVGTTRASLRDVRSVLTETAVVAPGALDDLVAGIAASRHVVRRQEGTPRPLPPDLQTVAYRVFQEMLTNALRHGTDDGPLTVGTAWDDRAVVLTVVNSAGSPQSVEGLGVPGMVRRLQSVGGTFTLDRSGDVVTATATVPVRPA